MTSSFRVFTIRPLFVSHNLKIVIVSVGFKTIGFFFLHFLFMVCSHYGNYFRSKQYTKMKLRRHEQKAKKLWAVKTKMWLSSRQNVLNINICVNKIELLHININKREKAKTDQKKSVVQPKNIV